MEGIAEILSDGTALLFYHNNHLAVDINGPNKGKNMYGYDIFSFQFFESINSSDNYLSVVPDVGGTTWFTDQICSEEYDENDEIVETCYYDTTYNTAWVIQNGNLDYLKVDENGNCPNGKELNWTTNTSCN